MGILRLKLKSLTHGFVDIDQRVVHPCSICDTTLDFFEMRPKLFS